MSVERGVGVGDYLFLKNAILRLGLGLTLTLTLKIDFDPIPRLTDTQQNEPVLIYL